MTAPSAPSGSRDAAALLLSNALDFLNGGLRLLFAEEATRRDAKVAVVSIQTATELLLKHRLVNEDGLSSIVRGKPPKGDLVTAASSGNLYTIGYARSLRRVMANESINEAEHLLFQRAQRLRNALVHFTARVDVEEVRQDIAWVLIRALAMFAAGPQRDHGEMNTHARFLDADNFHRLTNYGPYRAEAVDSAVESLDSDDVYRCWECGVDALSVRPSENYFCHCCGFAVVGEAASFADCTFCGENSAVLFDPLNETGGVHHGRCLSCSTFAGVFVCQECGKTRSQAKGLPAPTCAACGASPTDRSSHSGSRTSP